MATTFASEKLEDLNRWPTWDPHVCAASGTHGGQPDRGRAGGQRHLQRDHRHGGLLRRRGDFRFSGAVCETVSSERRRPDLYLDVPHTGRSHDHLDQHTANAIDVGAVAFHRRWTIEKDQPITGVKRITVLVTLSNGYMNPPISVQESTVRP